VKIVGLDGQRASISFVNPAATLCLLGSHELASRSVLAVGRPPPAGAS
jgi:hypothetical protein